MALQMSRHSQVHHASGDLLAFAQALLGVTILLFAVDEGLILLATLQRYMPRYGHQDC